MAALSDADVAKVIQALEAHGYSVRQRDAAAAAPRVLLEEKYFRRIEKYGGETAKWQEWLFAVCVAISGISKDCVVAMEGVVQKAGLVKNISEMDMDKDLQNKFGSELFGVLCSLTSGEANVVVRSVLQKGGGYCGLQLSACCASASIRRRQHAYFSS